MLKFKITLSAISLLLFYVLSITIYQYYFIHQQGNKMTEKMRQSFKSIRDEKTRKQILALVREENYAHAGETEAILRMFAAIPKDPDRKLLDVGSGLGGTAQYLQQHGWGQVTGIDIEPRLIEQAQMTYPNINFYVADVLKAEKTLSNRFDVIYLFNTLYAIEDQLQALLQMREVSTENATLLIFDYVLQGDYQDLMVAYRERPDIPYPLQLETLPTLLEKAKWRLEKVENLDEDYLRWYQHFLKKIKGERSEIEELVGPDGYKSFYALYANLLYEIQQGTLGGAIIQATAIEHK